MILVDTHIWIWWVHGDPALPAVTRELLDAADPSGIGVSAISCGEVAKLVEYKRLLLPCPVEHWMHQALSDSAIRFLELSPQISVESTRLPAGFHRDPADQIIVATARIHNVPLITADSKILHYPHVRLWKPER